jgi:hypothetical protein
MCISLVIPKPRNWNFDVQGQKKMMFQFYKREKFIFILPCFSLSKSSKNWIPHTHRTQASVSSFVFISYTWKVHTHTHTHTHTHKGMHTKKACMSISTPYKHWCKNHWKFMHSFPFISIYQIKDRTMKRNIRFYTRESHLPFPILEEFLHI